MNFSHEAQEALEKLKAGNQRFINGQFAADNTKQRREELLKGQHPFATILTCSDSRVVPEYIFDQGLGNLFIVRTAGELYDDISLASIEYGVEHLQTPLLIVLGHSLCGAVSTTVSKAHVHGHLPCLVEKIQPAMQVCLECNPNQSGDALLNEVIKENVLEIVESFVNKSELIQHQIKSGKTSIVGAIYHLKDGHVEFLIDHQSYLSKMKKKKL